MSVSATSNVRSRTYRLVKKYRKIVEDYIFRHPEFLTSLKPVDCEPQAPTIISSMCLSGKIAGVGPMAAVAGAMAEFVGRELSNITPELIIENGGDIFLQSNRQRKIAIFAGASPFSGRLNLVTPPCPGGFGICTSSGTVGHSLSFGKADAVTITSPSASLADAIATACCNLVQTENDINKGLDFARSCQSVEGALIIVNDKIGIWGKIELERT